ncbi:MAG: diacylglycerol kinase [Pseudomonadota bacterium]
MKNRPFAERMGFAIEGWRTGWRRENSFRTQARMGAVALVALIVLRPAPVWWALVVLVSVAVMALELLNSAMEAVIDLLHPGIHPSVKAAKDMLAGAVLLMSCAALVVGAAMVVATGPRFLAEMGLW